MAGGKQRMRIASKKHSQNVNARGNVPKSLAVSLYTIAQSVTPFIVWFVCFAHRKLTTKGARLDRTC